MYRLNDGNVTWFFEVCGLVCINLLLIRFRLRLPRGKGGFIVVPQTVSASEPDATWGPGDHPLAAGGSFFIAL
ncbi:hypothetical protein DSLASN_06100 [Desulfoluna limicola]|uniref:Uncharacterized protein n=1 Tax=Desulfoluna limicola TaxID=2810562 RepID=A0ABM7PBR8_9BACT|nr:hypothetical protein DSLASN_06100 [Desulfoluna limicola]